MKVAFVLGALMLAFSGGASGAAPALVPPSGLHAFVYLANEPVRADHTYAQMPAFAWDVVRGARRYELQLATSKTFGDGAMLLDQTNLTSPVTSLQLQVPWMTGNPYALWVRVRATAGNHVSDWSAPFGFNTAWQQLPTQLSAPAGLLRWSTVDGATAYEVWFPDIGVRFRTLTNVSDEREFWTLHPQLAGTVHWRVRAVRFVDAPSLPDKVQISQFGPYSPTFTTLNQTTLSNGGIAGTDAISNVDSTASTAAPNAIMPGFSWKGTAGVNGETGSGLFRVYVFSDKACVNSVTIGSIVGGPAWAPRDQAPIMLPTTVAAMSSTQAGTPFAYGNQGGVMADSTTVVTSESAGTPAAGSSSGGSSGSGASSGGSSAPSGSGTTTDTGTQTDPGSIALPDRGWPAGRYWWTVVPVAAELDRQSYSYVDLELPQDACAAGHVWSFGMQSLPVIAQGATPLASGSNGTRVVSAATRLSTFVELPVITWQPALGAQSYEIQLSRSRYPWVPAMKLTAVVPSATLPLTKADTGVWYYRVRGVNPNLPGTATQLTWSQTAAIRISGDVFRRVK